MNARHGSRDFLALSLVLTMAVLFFFPVLFQGKTQIHAESVSLGVALMHMLAEALQGDGSLLWTTAIYGGHPIFAEGQGGFTNPLHLLLAGTMPAVPAFNVQQFLCMVIGGIGCYGMCRSVRCTPAASCFAALALLFSTLWAGGFSNLAIASTMIWIPWACWALHRWLARADTPSACFFGTSMALMVLSGYPQLVHGALIYMVVYLGAMLCSARERQLMWQRRQPLCRSLVLAILICVGLSAVQWLPLLELAGQSHRSAGVSIIPQDSSSTAVFLRGFLFTFADPAAFDDISAGSGTVYFHAMGSLLVALVFSMVVLCKRSANTNAHLVATLFLIVLGFGVGGTPLFKYIYDWHLIPGLHNFRVSFTYLYVALVGFALICALVLDQLARAGEGSAHRGDALPGRRIVAAVVLWVVLWTIALFLLHVDTAPIGQYVIALTWLGVCGTSVAMGRRSWLPAAAVLLLAVEIVSYRVDTYRFGDVRLISKPQSIAALERQPGLREYRFLDRTYARTYSLHHPRSDRVARGLAAMLASATPAANVLWDLDSFSGNLALDLKRHALAEALIDTELTPGSEAAPGLRLMDFLAIKYLAVGQGFDRPGFRDAYVDPEVPVRLVENPYAYPRLQAFDELLPVATAEEAAAALPQLERRMLVIERRPGDPLEGMDGSLARGAQWRLLIDTPDRYVVETRAEHPFWLFLADANYPGWRAYLDRNRVSLYSAQLLGKAVYIPAGTHELELVFEPPSFRIGLWTSLVTLLAMSCWLLLQRVRSRRGL